MKETLWVKTRVLSQGVLGGLPSRQQNTYWLDDAKFGYEFLIGRSVIFDRYGSQIQGLLVIGVNDFR